MLIYSVNDQPRKMDQ